MDDPSNVLHDPAECAEAGRSRANTRGLTSRFGVKPKRLMLTVGLAAISLGGAVFALMLSSPEVRAMGTNSGR